MARDPELIVPYHFHTDCLRGVLVHVDHMIEMSHVPSLGIVLGYLVGCQEDPVHVDA